MGTAKMISNLCQRCSIRWAYLLVALTLLPCCMRAQQSGTDFTNRIDSVHNAIYQHYFIPEERLFREKTLLKAGEQPYAYLWPLCALIQSANELETLSMGTGKIDSVESVIRRYYNPTKLPRPGYDSYILTDSGHARFYDDNQWIGIAYADAFLRTKELRYLTMAEEIHAFMMTGWDTVAGGGLYWKEFDPSSKNTCSNAPGAVLSLKLLLATGRTGYLDTARMLYDWTRRRLRAPDGIYYDAVLLPADTVDHRKYTYNTGTMIESGVLLYQATGKRAFLRDARKSAKSAMAFFMKDGMLPDNFWFNAVLLRGYEALYKVDGSKQYIRAFGRYAQKAWDTQRDANGLLGTENQKILLDQAGYLEIIARLQRLGVH
jgi:hypothetical protein